MSERPVTQLPQAIEDAVLAILEGDDALREQRLRELLREHPQHERALRTWLAASGVDAPITVISSGGTMQVAGDDSDALPMRIGPYVLQALLGRGGFGTVYRAEQQEPIRRPVAIKVLNPGMDSREILARFTAEREALNRMDHPGIARLLDAGTTPKGRPFFAMELVEGPPLITHCRRSRLAVRQRIELFLKVLDAMQHAHQKAVLHRDLSSNNVLVADPGGAQQPKIIDFGIAKSMNAPLLQGGALTFQGTLMGTPEFMSPEQASGRIDDLDTRADVYALGVQLYELLTDHLPIPGVVLRAQGLAGMANVVRTYEPARPSDAAPRERRTLLRGDLDAITMRALAKSPNDRYASVGELATDLRHFLADEPVQMATVSTWLRVRKFVRRNRAQSIAVAIVAVGLLVAFVTMFSSLRYANAQFEEAQRQRTLSENKADAGFRLLANEERLAEAITAERELPPPWPEHRAAYTAWLQQHAQRLQAEHEKLHQRLESLPATDADEQQRHLRKALVRLDAALHEFAHDDGPLQSVQRRLELLDAVVAPLVAGCSESWQQTIAVVRTTPAYRNLALTPQPGLVPLGCDPRTGLCEFLELASHAPATPLPVRDPETGLLPTETGTGLVFVLLPGAHVRLGARRGQHGLDFNDELAADDELGGGSVALEPFLIARTEITEAQWSRLCGTAFRIEDPRLPVTGRSHAEASYVLSRFGMQLPTEAQWEYACRAGNRAPWCSGDDLEAARAFGWLDSGPHHTALLRPNAFGLHDMHGNVAEWCADAKLPYVDTTPRPGDGLRLSSFASNAPHQALRGGSWNVGNRGTRATARDGKPSDWRDATIGVRPARRLITR